jgi:WD40 repeat protein
MIPTQASDVDAWAVRFSADGSRIAIGSLYQVDVWEWRAKRKELTLLFPKGANPTLLCGPIDFSKDRRYLAVGLGNSSGNIGIRVWNSSDWSVAADIADPLPGAVTAIEFAPGGSQLIFARDRAGPKAENVFGYDMRTRQMTWSLAISEFFPACIGISPDGKWLAVEGTAFSPAPREITDAAERLSKSSTRLEMQIIQLPQLIVSKVLQPHVLGKLAWSPDGTRIAIAGAGATEILKFPSGDSADLDRPPSAAHMTAAFSPDGSYLIEGDMNGKGTGQGLFIWDSTRRKLIQKMSGNISSVDMPSDSRYLATGGRGKTTIYQVK